MVAGKRLVLNMNRWPIGLLGLAFVAMGAVWLASRASLERDRFATENAFCAKGDRRGGGRLVRGNDGAYVCIDPRVVKWERPQ